MLTISLSACRLQCRFYYGISAPKHAGPTKPQMLTSVCAARCLHFSLTSYPLWMSRYVFGGRPALETQNFAKIVILHKFPQMHCCMPSLAKIIRCVHLKTLHPSPAHLVSPNALLRACAARAWEGGWTAASGTAAWRTQPYSLLSPSLLSHPSVWEYPTACFSEHTLSSR